MAEYHSSNYKTARLIRFLADIKADALCVLKCEQEENEEYHRLAGDLENLYPHVEVPE